MLFRWILFCVFVAMVAGVVVVGVGASESERERTIVVWVEGADAEVFHEGGCELVDITLLHPMRRSGAVDLGMVPCGECD